MSHGPNRETRPYIESTPAAGSPETARSVAADRAPTPIVVEAVRGDGESLAAATVTIAAPRGSGRILDAPMATDVMVPFPPVTNAPL